MIRWSGVITKLSLSRYRGNIGRNSNTCLRCPRSDVDCSWQKVCARCGPWFPCYSWGSTSYRKIYFYIFYWDEAKRVWMTATYTDKGVKKYIEAKSHKSRTGNAMWLLRIADSPVRERGAFARRTTIAVANG